MPRLSEETTSLLDVARAFQAEYDGLRASRAIRLYLKFRNKLSKHPYEPLTLEAPFPEGKAWMRLAARTNAGNQHFYRSFPDLISKLPESNGSSYYAGSRRPRVGIITDEFMFDYYDGPLDLTYLFPDTYEKEIRENDFDFILYVTCWHGRHDQVDNYYSNDPAGHERISAVFSCAKRAGIPIVFQSIEDPPSFHLYLDLAKQADWVFTSCAEKIPSYREELGHDRVFSCLFGVNPELNNPIGIGMRSHLGNSHLRNSVLFAGSWYDEYPERCADTQIIFDALIERGVNLVVFDRRWPLDWAGQFPERYWGYLLPGINHRQLQGVTKLFDFAVNLNSVKDSTTMCAMRTYELQACGVIGIANDALALRSQFPELPRIAEARDLDGLFDRLTDEERLRIQLDGIRRIMTSHTVYDRLNEMFEHMGMDFRFEKKRTAIVADSANRAAWENAQSIVEAVDGTCAVDRSSANSALEGSGFSYAMLVDEHVPAPFVQDAINAMKYTNCPFVKACDKDSEPFDYTQGTFARRGVLVDLSKSRYDIAGDEPLNGLAFAIPQVL